MDYKKMKPIGLVRIMLTDGVITKEQAAKYFPELAESEDEKIRKWIYRIIEYLGFSADEDAEKELVKMQPLALAWLEKQGEQKSIWHNEDEELIKWSINNLTELKDRFGEEYGKVGDCINFLKSLKERYTWKPSDEQMNALREAIFEMGKSASCCNIEEFHGIESLYNDLKKLKG